MRYFSVQTSDSDILQALSDIHLKGEWFDLDCTYSKGVFYKDCKQPRYKSDLIPLFNFVTESDCRELDFIGEGSIHSIVFDPPFLFRKRKSENKDKISARFSYFKSYEELINMYIDSLKCFYNKLDRGGMSFSSVRI